MKIVADDKIPFLRGTLDDVAEVVYKRGADICRADVADADVLIVRTRTKCNEALLHDTKVSGIFTATIGYDHIDTTYCDAHNIYWQNAPGCNAASVEQYVASALAVLRLRHDVPLRGRVIAVVGLGHVGSRVATLARRLGMKVLMVDPPRAEAEKSDDYISFDTALRLADIVSFHVPLTCDGPYPTFHLLNENTLSRLKRGSIVINTSRGPVCQTEALKKGLTDGTIRHAIVDVWENEPNIDKDLMWQTAISTPHIAGYSTDSKRRGTQMVIDAINEHYGLGLKYTLSTLPTPAEHSIILPQNIDAEEAACRMFLHIYDIESDSRWLRTLPMNFEEQRGNYHLRREIGAFSVAKEYKHYKYLKSFGLSD